MVVLLGSSWIVHFLSYVGFGITEKEGDHILLTKHVMIFNNDLYFSLYK